MDEHIVDVEVIAEKIDEPQMESKVKRVASSDRSRQVNFYIRLYLICSRFGFGSFLLFLLGGFAFSILYSQATDKPVFQGFMIAFWVCTGFAAIFYLLGFLFKKLANRNMAKDPNYRGEQL